MKLYLFFTICIFKEKNDIFKDKFIYFGENDDKLFGLFNDIPGHESVPYLKYSEQSDEVKLLLKNYFYSRFEKYEVPAFLLNVNKTTITTLGSDLRKDAEYTNGYLSYLSEDSLEDVADCLLENGDAQNQKMILTVALERI